MVRAGISFCHGSGDWGAVSADQPGESTASRSSAIGSGTDAFAGCSASRPANATSRRRANAPGPTHETNPQPQGTPSDTVKKPELKPGVQAKTTTKKRRHKHTASKSTTSTPEKKVVRNGGTADPAIQLAPGVSNEQASRQRQSTTQLLSAADTNLKQISVKQLSPSQQESVSQIRKYMEQAKAAEAAGDLQRAQNLASKARLLSDDLVKH